MSGGNKLAIPPAEATIEAGIGNPTDTAWNLVAASASLVALAKELNLLLSGLTKLEDAPHVSGDQGVLALTIRNDTFATILTNANGDNSGLATDDRGAIWAGIAQGVAAGDSNSSTVGFVRTGGGNNALIGVDTFVNNGATWDKLRTPNVFKPIAPTAVTAGTGITIWTPAGGKKFRLMGWRLSVTVAGEIIFGDNAIATIIARTGLLPANDGKESPPGMGNGILSAAANNVLKLDVTVGATVQGVVFGTEE